MKHAFAPLLFAAAALGAAVLVHSHSDEDADPNDLSFKYATPILDVKSVEASIEHYTTKLGFTENWDWPDDAEDKTFGSVTNGEVSIFLAETPEPIKPTWVFYDVNNADNVYKAYVEAGATIRQAPNDKPWGSREFHAEDLDGNVLRIASPLPHEHD
ncbi:MAG: VOC family protein [Gammaproteobacteria bacterium]|nr:VOC family protein [Gammaproteobacteria bacterium]